MTVNIWWFLLTFAKMRMFELENLLSDNNISEKRNVPFSSKLRIDKIADQ